MKPEDINPDPIASEGRKVLITEEALMQLLNLVAEREGIVFEITWGEPTTSTVEFYGPRIIPGPKA